MAVFGRQCGIGALPECAESRLHSACSDRDLVPASRRSADGAETVDLAETGVTHIPPQQTRISDESIHQPAFGGLAENRTSWMRTDHGPDQGSAFPPLGTGDRRHPLPAVADPTFSDTLILLHEVLTCARQRPREMNFKN